jgi:signal transduction histidine kinase
MNLLSLASYTGFLVSMVAGIDGLRRNSKTMKGVLFFLFSLSVGIWCLGYAFLYAADNETFAWFWYRLTAPIWCFLPALVFHFVMILTEVKGLRKSVTSFLYLIALVFSWKALTGVLMAKEFLFRPDAFATIEVHAVDSPWYRAYLVYQIGSLSAGFFLLIKWRMRTNVVRFKKQANLIIGFFLATLLFLNALSFLPSFSSSPWPNIAPAVLVLIMIGTWYAITRYRMLDVTPELAAGYIMSKMLDGVLLVDAAGTIRDANNRILEMLRIRRRALIGQRLIRLFPTTDSFDPMTEFDIDKLDSTATLEREVLCGFSLEDAIPVLAAFSLLLDSAGEVGGAVVVVHDLRFRRELETAKLEAEKADRAKARFLAHMSHDIKTPLNSIIGYAQLLVSDDELSSRNRRLSISICESGNHLLELLSDILDATQMEAGRMVIERKGFSFRNLLREIAIGYRLTAKRHGLDFRVYLGPNLPMFLLGDKKRILQILNNILSNAVKYTPVGGRVECEVGTSSDETSSARVLRIIVSDTGPGISEELQKSIFEPFARGAEYAGRVEGQGLGLTISRELTRMMGGILEYRDAEIGGSSFIFTIPVEICDKKNDAQWCEEAFVHSTEQYRMGIDSRVPIADLLPSEIPAVSVLGQMRSLIGDGDVGAFIEFVDGHGKNRFPEFFNYFRTLAEGFQIHRIQDELEIFMSSERER